MLISLMSLNLMRIYCIVLFSPHITCMLWKMLHLLFSTLHHVVIIHIDCFKFGKIITTLPGKIAHTHMGKERLYLL